jgi:hypothetical protein
VGNPSLKINRSLASNTLYSGFVIKITDMPSMESLSRYVSALWQAILQYFQLLKDAQKGLEIDKQQSAVHCVRRRQQYGNCHSY